MLTHLAWVCHYSKRKRKECIQNACNRIKGTKKELLFSCASPLILWWKKE
jgi:hypothetical protein